MSEAAPGPAVWELPPIDGPVLARHRRGSDLTALEREAWDKGYAEGREAALQAVQQQQGAALAEIERRATQLGAVLDFMAQPLAELDQQVQRQLALLAGAIARQVVRREIKLQPEEIIGVIRETVTLLPANAREVRVHLHPDDAKLVRTRLAEAAGSRAWSIAEDPILSRGGCRVTSGNATIDARLEQRLGAAIAAALGDARAGGAQDSP
jgi:flagellar assembly protein FliH